MKYTFRPRGVCSQQVSLDLEDGIIKNLEFYGGCHGNLQALSRLLEGMPVSFAIERLKGIKCGYKMTSCADQLIRGIENALNMAESSS